MQMQIEIIHLFFHFLTSLFCEKARCDPVNRIGFFHGYNGLNLGAGWPANGNEPSLLPWRRRILRLHHTVQRNRVFPPRGSGAE